MKGERLFDDLFQLITDNIQIEKDLFLKEPFDFWQNDKEQRLFAIKAIPTANVRPVIVFINPKSGGNQGAKLMQKFQWLLNPRQVFDLTQGGPKAG